MYAVGAIVFDVFPGSRYVLGGFVSDGELQINVAPGIPRPDCESAVKVDARIQSSSAATVLARSIRAFCGSTVASRRPWREYWLT